MNLTGWIGHQVNRSRHARLRARLHRAGKLAACFEQSMRRMHLPREQRKRYWLDFRTIVKKYAGE